MISYVHLIIHVNDSAKIRLNERKSKYFLAFFRMGVSLALSPTFILRHVRNLFVLSKMSGINLNYSDYSKLFPFTGTWRLCSAELCHTDPTDLTDYYRHRRAYVHFFMCSCVCHHLRTLIARIHTDTFIRFIRDIRVQKNMFICLWS